MLLILVWMKGKKNNTKHLLPPGSNSWSIIEAFIIGKPSSSSTPRELVKKYRDIMCLRLGSVLTVVVSSPEMAKEFLKSRDMIFASPTSAAGKYMTYNSMDVVLAPYGPKWSHLRKNCTMELLSAKCLDSFKYVREEEVCKIMQSIWKESVNGMIHVDMRKSTRKQFKTMVDEILTLNTVVNIAYFIPYIQWTDLQGLRRRMKNVHRAFDEFVEEIIDQHIERSQKSDQGVGSGDHKDFMDVLL
eukprot:Gb_31930 [translate_table: standard]